MRTAANVFRLGVKELWTLARDPMLVVLIVFSFTAQIVMAATSMRETLNKAAIAVVDEDGSPLSTRIKSAFYPPRFMPPTMLELPAVDPGLDNGDYTFVIDVPPNFQRDVLARRAPQLQLDVDATRVAEAFAGSGYVQQIVLSEVDEFVQRYRGDRAPAIDFALRVRFNPNLERSWFAALMEIINNVTMLSFILTGAAMIREREHGTIEHLLAMPVTPAEIMLSKVWSMGLVVLVSATLALLVIVRGVLQVPIAGSVALFVFGAALDLFAMTALGIFMATLARSMPQFAMLTILILLPLQMLSGGSTPRESMPLFAQHAMLLAPSTHFVIIGQAILYRGAGFAVVWPQFVALAAIGAVCFGVSLNRFRKTIGLMSGA